MQATVLEQRLAALEQEVARLKQRLDQVLSQTSWLERVAGSMKDEPEFEEVVRLGAAIRQAGRPPEGQLEIGSCKFLY